MPPTATLEDIKAHQERVEKNKIRPDNLPPCPRCKVASEFFKIHAYRERRFLIIIEMMIQAVYCSLVRFGCPACPKTFTHYPDFAIPYKHYTRQSVAGFANQYVASDQTTYQKAVMVVEQRSVPGYPDGEKSLSPSTLHRWVTSLSTLPCTTRTASKLIGQENPATKLFRNLAFLMIAPGKYKRLSRKKQLIDCLRLLVVETFFKATFYLSIFTNLAIHCSFT